MPRFKSEKVKVPDDQLREVPFQRNINVDSEGEFSCLVPVHICEVINGSDYAKMHAKTLRELLRDWTNLMHEYRTIIKEKKEKYIHVKFKADYHCTVELDGTEDEDDLDCEGRKWRNRDDLSAELTPAIGLDYTLIFKAGENYYHLDIDTFGDQSEKIGREYSETKTNRWNSDEEIILIPWTQEREEFFKKAKSGIENMALKIESFLSKANKNPALLEGSGTNLLAQ